MNENLLKDDCEHITKPNLDLWRYEETDWGPYSVSVQNPDYREI